MLLPMLLRVLEVLPMVVLELVGCGGCLGDGEGVYGEGQVY